MSLMWKETMQDKRINVALSNEAQQAIAATQKRTGLNKTAVANRALVLYEFLSNETGDDGKLIVRREGQPDTLIRFL